VCKKTKDICTLLLITTFQNKNPMTNDDVANSLNITKDELVKRLVAIHPASSLVA
jgi:hypothetical protein